MRRASLRSIATVGSNSLTSHANRTGASRSGKIVIGAPPLRPATTLSHVSSRVLPIGVTMPMPVKYDATSPWRAQSHLYIPNPPSTASTAPVTKPDASETRKRTQRAMSSGSPSRPSGVEASSASRALSGSTSVSSVEM